MLYQMKNPHGGDVYDGEIRLDFSANTNPFGTPESIKDAIRSALDQVHQYPDPFCRELVSAISQHEQLPPEYILCGNGAADLIYAFCEAIRPRRALELAPTFHEYALALKRVGCAIERYTLRKDTDFALTEGFLEELRIVSPDVVFLCNPNNPTGRTIEPELLKRILDFCARQKIYLFVDECFLDLTDGEHSLKQYLESYTQLVILKAFTKSFGIAGIRLGYCLSGNNILLGRMSQASQPWNVSVLAQKAGVAALKEMPFLQTTKELVTRERQWLAGELEALGFWVCPGEANFLLFKAGQDIHTGLKTKGIAIRNCDNYYGLGAGWYRTAVRTHEDNLALITAMKEVLGKV